MQVLEPRKVGQTIKHLCTEQGITPTALAERIGLASVQAVYFWYSGRNLPSIDNLYLLAQILGVTVDYLLCGSEFSETD